MQKYYNVVEAQGSNFLSAVPNASVAVYTSPGNVLATIYSDNGVTIAANPLTTAVDGSFSFYAANGRYSLVISNLGVSKTLNDIVLEDDPVNGQPVVITGGTIDNTPIGSTTPSTGAFTSLSSTSGALNGTVGATTPAAGAFTSLSSTSGALNGSLGATTPSTVAATTISATGTITPSQTAGVVGTTTNNNANAGSVGEYVTASFSGVALTTNVQANLTSISLTAGDWDVSGGVNMTGGASNILLNSAMGISTTSATLGGIGTYAQWQGGGTVLATVFAAAMPTQRLSLSATTTVYAVGLANFASSTVSAAGYIRARRIR